MRTPTEKRPRESARRGVPKYRAIASELTAQIRAGRHQPGDLLPSELELARRFEVSRHTVRSALRSLYERGLVVSQHGRGTVVQTAPVAPLYSHACDSIQDVLQYAAATPRQVVSRERRVADESLAEWLGCAPGYTWWEVHTCRSREPGGPVVASSQIWVPDKFGDAVAELERTDDPLFIVIDRLHDDHFAQIRQTLSVAKATTQEARDLDMEPGDAVMCVERRFIDERGGLLEVARSVHPPETFRYETTLQRVRGA